MVYLQQINRVTDHQIIDLLELSHCFAFIFPFPKKSKLNI
jgi:hypothetical protein